jgi:hypothetical protein
MLKSVLSISVFLIAVGVPSRVNSQDLKRQFVGTSGCNPEFRRGPGTYGTRLDSRQRAYLKAYSVDDHNILLIVQYSDDKDQCGIVRDVVRPTDASAIFVWDCTDSRAPHDVAVGTWPARYPSPYGPAIVAWRINLRELKFISIPGTVAVLCTSAPGPEDESPDLLDFAKKRQAKFQ